MKVLIVVHGFPPLAESGCEVYAHAHARALATHFGDDVLVLTREQDTSRGEYAVRSEQRDGLRIVRINNTFSHTRSFEDSYRNDAIGALAANLVDDFRPEVAHIHHLTGLSTTIVSTLTGRGVPCFMTLHDYWLMCHRGQLFDLDRRICGGPGASGDCGRCLGLEAAAPPSAFLAARAMSRVLPTRLAKAFMNVSQGLSPAAATSDAEAQRTEHMRGVMAHVTRFLAPSNFMRDRFIEFGVPPDRIVHWPYGFEVPSDGPAKAGPHVPTRAGPHVRAEPGARSLRLGFIGSLMVSKAPHLTIEAARGLDGVAGVDLFGALTPYHGDDSYLRYLAPLLVAEGVRHHGPIPHRRIPDALASIDVLVVPSAWPENSPLVIQEAFLAGVPVIASRIGGIPELVEHDRNGLLFQPGDVEDLRRAIARVVHEPDLLDRLRAGIGPVRAITDDVAAERAMYADHVERHAARLSTRSTGSGQAGSGRANGDCGKSRRMAAVVLNYRTPDDTYLAVRSLLASRRPLDEIIVVNNDDHDGDRKPTVLRHIGSTQGLRQIDTGRNLGFSGGVNVGIRTALDGGADAVLLVNSDVILPPDCIERLERAMSETTSHRDCGIIAPVIANRSAPGVVATSGMSYDPLTGRMRHRGVGALVARAPRGIQPPKPVTVDAVSACAVLITRDVFDAIGLFEEDYFFSFEDLDFCLRARRAGFETLLAGDAIAYHEGSRSIGANTPERLYFAARNHLLLASRATPTSSRLRQGYRVSAIVVLNLAHAMISRGAPLPRRLGAVVRGTRDYVLSRFGARTLATTRGSDRPAGARSPARSGAAACCETDDPAGRPRGDSSTRA